MFRLSNMVTDILVLMFVFRVSSSPSYETRLYNFYIYTFIGCLNFSCYPCIIFLSQFIKSVWSDIIHPWSDHLKDIDLHNIDHFVFKIMYLWNEKKVAKFLHFIRLFKIHILSTMTICQMISSFIYVIISFTIISRNQKYNTL